MQDANLNRTETAPPTVSVESDSYDAGPAPDNDDAEEDLGGGHSLPNPEELRANASPVSSGVGETLACMLLLVLLSAAIIGLSVGLTAENREEKKNGNYVGKPVMDDSKRLERMKSYFIQQGVNVEADFNDKVGPQSKAIRFLAVDDKRNLEVPNGGLDTDEGYALLTRYVMTIIYYAMNGKSWHFEMLFLTDHDTCEWFEVFQGALGQVGVLCHEQTRKITGLSFINNNLEGNLPKELGHLSTISYLESIGNGISGNLPGEIAKLTNLRTLVMAGGLLSGPLPTWIGGLTQLDFLFLSNNNFQGTIPNTWANLQNLAVLALDDNALQGSLDIIWQYPKMEYLYVEDNQFAGELPASIVTTSPLLIDLDVSSNNLDGQLPSDLFQLSNLKILDLHQNAFSGPLPNNIPDNERLYFIALHDNDFTGNIPATFGNLRGVTHLDLSDNGLDGVIPVTLNKMEKLEYLFLANNPFTRGPIPTFIYDFENLQELSMKGTNRDGSLLHLVAFLDKVVLFDLDNNSLSGTIPSEIGLMEKLQFLLLNRNQLTGPVPDELGDLLELRVFMLDRNNVTGSLDAPCALGSIELAVADCEEVDCICCNPCCEDDKTCHDFDLVANINPVWELSYKRQFFDFSDTVDAFNVGDDDVLANVAPP